jgi:hypothetical protein
LVAGDEERRERNERPWKVHRDGLDESRKRLERSSSWTERVWEKGSEVGEDERQEGEGSEVDPRLQQDERLWRKAEEDLRAEGKRSSDSKWPVSTLFRSLSGGFLVLGNCSLPSAGEI